MWPYLFIFIHIYTIARVVCVSSVYVALFVYFHSRECLWVCMPMGVYVPAAIFSCLVSTVTVQIERYTTFTCIHSVVLPLHHQIRHGAAVVVLVLTDVFVSVLGHHTHQTSQPLVLTPFLFLPPHTPQQTSHNEWRQALHHPQRRRDRRARQGMYVHTYTYMYIHTCTYIHVHTYN